MREPALYRILTTHIIIKTKNKVIVKSINEEKGEKQAVPG
jgi:hypothetical protein